jgi:hypothetical protein
MNMTTVALRQKLHQFIDAIEEKKIKAIYTLFENEIEQSEIEYTDEFKADLDKRIEYYRNGGKMVTPTEMNKRIKAIRQR